MSAPTHSPLSPYNSYNQTFAVKFRAGLLGSMAGENQAELVRRQIESLNSQGLRVTALTTERWSVWRRVLWGLTMICTLGFVARVPNVIIVTERMQPVPPPRTSRVPAQRAAESPAIKADH